MKIERRHFQRLRAPFLFALCLLLLAIAIVHLALDAGSAAEADYRTAQAGHDAMENRLRRLAEQREEIGKRAVLYRRLQESGVVGPERRLDWGELLHDLQQRRLLPEMTYRFAAPRSLDGSDLPGFRASSMQLNLELFHEEELLDFLAALQQEARALVLLHSCSLSRKPGAGGESSARLQAQCELDWVTLQGVEP